MKRFLRFLLRFILKLIPALVCTAGVIVYLSLHYSVLSEGPGQDIGFEYVDKEIYVNGAHIYNFQLMHPVVQGVEINSVDPEKIFGRPSKDDDQVTLLPDEEEDSKPSNTFKVAAAENWLNSAPDMENIFVPLDSGFQNMLGLQLLVSGDLVQIIKTEGVLYQKPEERAYIAETPLYFEGTPYIDIEALLCPQFMGRGSLDLTDHDDRLRFYLNNFLAENFDRYADRRQEEVFIDLSSKDFYWVDDPEASQEDYVPMASDRPGKLLYVRLSALEAVPEFEISKAYDPVSGIYISSSAKHSAQEYLEAGNASYISGRAEYMRNIQRRLDQDTAFYMEYLFRKYSVFNDVEEELLIGLCRTESAYTLELRSTAIGIMQLMPGTVRGWGWTVEDVSSLEGNISFGSMYIKYMLDAFGGDQVRALSAYNQGINRVRGGSYSTGYADRVLSYRNNIFNWCEENGYAAGFRDVIVLEDEAAGE